MFNKLKGLGLVVVLLALSACGSSGGTTPTPPPPPPAAPTISLFALAAPSTAGVDCLLFYAAPSENLQLLSASVSHQIGTSFGTSTENLGGQLTLPTERLALQSGNKCYPKITGEYRFVFTATRPNDPTQFTINSTYTQQNAVRR
jgi:hypothetical protein